MDAPEKQDSGALASADARDASEASHEAAASPTADDAAPQLGDVKLGLSSTFSASQPPPPDPAPALAPPTRWTFRYGPAYARPFTPAVQKWILLLATFSALMGPFAATMYSPALPEIQQDLNTTAALVNLTLTLGALITGFVPTIWAPISDIYGRRPVLIASTLLNISANIATFFVPNVALLLVMRIFSTAGSSAGISVGSGCVADVFPPAQRGRALGILFLGAIIGPIISPPIGGVIANSLGWRWIFLMVAFIGAAFLVPVFLFLPETLPSAFTPKSQRKRRPNPFSTFPYLRHPFVYTIVLEGVFSMIASFSIPATLPRIYMEKYGLNAAGNGLVLMSTGIGSIIGSILGGQMTDRQFRRYKALRGGVSISEDRLRSAYIGLCATPVGLLIYGWCTQATAPLAAPIVGLVLIGFGGMIISTATNSYLLDIFSLRAASIIALLNFIRYIFGCWIPIAAGPAEHAMGTGGFYTLLGGLTAFAAIGLLWTIGNGTRARAKNEPWEGKEETLAQLKALEETGEGLLMRGGGQMRDIEVAGKESKSGL